MEKIFIIRWFGPFQLEQVRDWEKLQKNTFNLYLISGKNKNSKKVSDVMSQSFLENYMELNNYNRIIIDALANELI